MKRLVALALLLAGSTARADPMADAEAEPTTANFEKCGGAYLDVYNRDPASPSNDETLYNAASCFERAHSAGAAEQMLLKVVAEFPNSRLRGRALVRLAKLAELTGRFDVAAARDEDYARVFAGEKDAYDAMLDAIAYRLALDDGAEAIADVKYFVNAFGAKRPAEAARAMLALGPIYEKRHEAIPHYESVLRDFKLDDAQRVIAIAKLGELQWDATCRGRALCVTELPRENVPRCVETTRVRVDKRTSTTAALATLALAVKTFEERQVTDPAARHAAAMSKLRIGDAALEAYLALEIPAGLDFSAKAKQKSIKAFSDWIAAKQKLGQIAMRSYEGVLVTKDAESSIAAAERIGRIPASFAASLRGGALPIDVHADKAIEKAYCDQMEEVAQPLTARAIEAFSMCLAKSIELGVESAWTAQCRASLAAIDPANAIGEPQLPPFAPSYPPPSLARAPRATKQDPPAYAAALADYEASAPCNDIAAKLRPLTSDSARYLSAITLVPCGRPGDARRALDAIPGPASLASRGTLAWLAGDKPAAIDAWTRAKQMNGKVATAWYGLALAQFDDVSKEREVELDLISARVADPETPAPVIMLAILEQRRGRTAIARSYLSQAVVESGALVVARAQVLARLGQWAGAANLLDDAVKRHAPMAAYDAALAMLHLHRYQEAFEGLAKLDPSYDVMVARGAALFGLRKLPEARAAFRAAVQIDPARPEATFDLALAK